MSGPRLGLAGPPFLPTAPSSRGWRADNVHSWGPCFLNPWELRGGHRPAEAAPSVSGSQGGRLLLARPGGLGDASVRSLPPAATAGGSALISRARVVTLGSLCQGQRGHVTTRSQEWCLITSNVLGVRAGWYPEGHNSDPTCSYFKIPRLVKCVILFFALENLVYFPHFCLTLTSVRAASTVCPVTAVPESSTARGMEQGAGITAFVKRMTGRGKE